MTFACSPAAFLPARHGTSPAPGMPGVTRVGWAPDGSENDTAAAALTTVVDDADAVINLAGESLGGKRWTAQRKAQLRDSRIHPTRALVSAIRSAARPPRVLVNASGAGYYGAAGDEPKTEDSPAGTDFLAQLCEDWEAEAMRASPVGTRVVILRTGIVLERSGGVLAKLLPPFRFFVGGPMGSGRQYMFVATPPRLPRNGPLDHRHAGHRRPGQRHCPSPGDQS